MTTPENHAADKAEALGAWSRMKQYLFSSKAGTYEEITKGDHAADFHSIEAALSAETPQPDQKVDLSNCPRYGCVNPIILDGDKWVRAWMQDYGQVYIKRRKL